MTLDVKEIQKYVAAVAIGPTTLRNMKGVNGKIDTARIWLYENIDLDTIIESDFLPLIDSYTVRLSTVFSDHKNEPNWGAARKAINIFLRDATYNFRLREFYQLSKIEPRLECPLDSFSMTEIKKAAKLQLEVPSVSSLSAGISCQFQSAASVLAVKRNLHRVHLDISFWLESKQQLKSL